MDTGSRVRVRSHHGNRESMWTIWMTSMAVMMEPATMTTHRKPIHATNAARLMRSYLSLPFIPLMISRRPHHVNLLDVRMKSRGDED